MSGQCCPVLPANHERETQSMRQVRKQAKALSKKLKKAGLTLEQVQTESTFLESKEQYLSLEELKKMYLAHHPEMADAHILPAGKNKLNVWPNRNAQERCIKVRYEPVSKSWFMRDD